MKMRKLRAPFSEAARMKMRLGAFSSVIQAEATAVIADPSRGASWGKAAETAVKDLVDRVHGVCESDTDVIAPSVRTLKAVQTSLEAVTADRFNDACYDGLGAAVSALTATAAPLQQAYRDILIFQQRRPALARKLNDYIRAGAFLPRSQELHDRLCHLSGFAKGLEIFGNQVAHHARAGDIRQAMRRMGPTLKTLPQECQHILKNFERDKDVLAHGLPAGIPVGKPLRFRK
jgi:hypothetical protein